MSTGAVAGRTAFAQLSRRRVIDHCRVQTTRCR
jgi:hypothetical protein